MLNRWDPFAEMMHMQDRFSRLGSGGQTRGTGFAPAVDIYEGDNNITIKAELPGVQAKDIHIDVENNILTLRGERSFEDEDQRDGYHRIERNYGAFFRSFVMPSTVNADTIEATLTNGVLTVLLPKRAEKQPRKISIKSAGTSQEHTAAPSPLSSQAGGGGSLHVSGAQSSGPSVSPTQGGTKSPTSLGSQGNGNGHGPYVR